MTRLPTLHILPLFQGFEDVTRPGGAGLLGQVSRVHGEVAVAGLDSSHRNRSWWVGKTEPGINGRGRGRTMGNVSPSKGPCLPQVSRSQEAAYQGGNSAFAMPSLAGRISKWSLKNWLECSKIPEQNSLY